MINTSLKKACKHLNWHITEDRFMTEYTIKHWYYGSITFSRDNITSMQWQVPWKTGFGVEKLYKLYNRYEKASLKHKRTSKKLKRINRFFEKTFYTIMYAVIDCIKYFIYFIENNIKTFLKKCKKNALILLGFCHNIIE